MCLKNCPEGFTDHGTSCVAPSVLRKPINAPKEACPQGQIELNGDCFEPQTITWSNNEPKALGCGCIRKKLQDRIQCPAGYVKIGAQCVTKCPAGFSDVKDASGSITSLYCRKDCPLKTNSRDERVPNIGGHCVKEFRSRTNHDKRNHPALNGPETMAKKLSLKVAGTSIAERYRSGFTVPQSLGSSNAGSSSRDLGSSAGSCTSGVENFFTGSWLGWVLLILIGCLLFYGGPEIFKAVATLISFILQAFGFVVKGTSSLVSGVETGVGAVATGAGSVVRGTANLLEKTENVVASNEGSYASKRSLSNSDTVAKGISDRALATQDLVNAQQGLQQPMYTGLPEY